MNEIITFSVTTIERLNDAAVNRFSAVSIAAREAVDTDKSVTVRIFADSLRAVTVGLGMNTCVLSAAIKAAKDGASVEQAMTDAAVNAANKAREARAKAKKRADKSSAVKALETVEDTLAKLGGREKSALLVQIEDQRGIVSALVADLKKAREELARLEAQYLAEQATAFKTA